MRKTKAQKGITLVALIITIIILLILAVVAIRAVQGDGILKYAQNAKEGYELAEENERATLDGYLSKIEGSIGSGATGNPGEGGGETPKELLTIGDKVAYNEGYSATKTSTVDSAFVMDDMDWRVLDVEDDGTVKLISTQPTTSTLTLSGEDGYLYGPNRLDQLCSDLYANGEGVTARSLKIEDIDELAGVLTEADKKSCTSEYGSWWRYKYDPTAGRIQYSTSTDYNPETKTGTWTDYAGLYYEKFKEPGKAEINSTNYQDAEGNPIVNEQKHTYYDYIISEKVTQVTLDGISIASLIKQGLNDDNNAVSGSNVEQWLSSRFVTGISACAIFGVHYVKTGTDRHAALWASNAMSNSRAHAVRPVVILSSEMFGEKVDGVWQINI